MKKIILMMAAAMTMSANADDFTCRLYGDTLNENFSVIAFKVKNDIPIKMYEIDRIKNDAANTYGHCGGNSELQQIGRKLAESAINWISSSSKKENK